MNRYVSGEPAPKGSVRAFPVRRASGRIGTVVTHGGRAKSWEAAIREQTADVQLRLEGPLRVELEFHLTRPKTVQRLLPSVRPDLDKLVRAVLDALKGVIQDDAQVTDLRVSKRYVVPGGSPGVRIIVSQILVSCGAYGN